MDQENCSQVKFESMWSDAFDNLDQEYDPEASVLTTNERNDEYNPTFEENQEGNIARDFNDRKQISYDSEKNHDGDFTREHRPRQDEEDVASRSVFLGNIDYNATSEEIQEHFRGCGLINRVTIVNDKISGRPRGFAFMEFADRESSVLATQLNGSMFRDRQIKVNLKQARPQRMAQRGSFRSRGRSFRDGDRRDRDGDRGRSEFAQRDRSQFSQGDRVRSEYSRGGHRRNEFAQREHRGSEYAQRDYRRNEFAQRDYGRNEFSQDQGRREFSQDGNERSHNQFARDDRQNERSGGYRGRGRDSHNSGIGPIRRERNGSAAWAPF